VTETPLPASWDETWLGYTFTGLHRIAERAAMYCRWADRLPYPERFDIAWAGIIDYLTGCDSPPEEFEVYKAAQRAIGHASSAELREHGLRHGPAGLYATPRFEIYWAPKPAPAADATVVDRIALWQIWATLRPLHKMALLALAARATTDRLGLRFARAEVHYVGIRRAHFHCSDGRGLDLAIGDREPVCTGVRRFPEPAADSAEVVLERPLCASRDRDGTSSDVRADVPPP